jgi:hypothetical protein
LRGLGPPGRSLWCSIHPFPKSITNRKEAHVKRLASALLVALALAGFVAAQAEEVQPVASPQIEAPAEALPVPGDGGELAPADPIEGTPEPVWLGNCPRYRACVCNCEYQLTWCLENFGQNCYDEWLECHDECIALWVSDGTQCGVINC